MAEPAPTVTAGGLSKGRDVWRWRNGNQVNACERELSEPAPTVHFGHNLNEVSWVQRPLTVRTGKNSSKHTRNTQEMVPYERPCREPAPTLDTNVGGAWKVAPEGEHGDPPMSWVRERPSTTVQGDPRVHPPGHKINGDDIAAGRTEYEGRAGKNAIRVTLEQAAVLQSFPVDYPFQGSNTAKFTQVGNAMPPLLAEAVLRSLTGGEE